MTEPTPLEPAQFFEFIRESEIAVVFVSAHRLHRMNRPLLEALESEHTGLVAGTVDLSALLTSNSSILRFLHQGLRHVNAPSQFGVLPGYHLFVQGEMVLWDAGLPGLGDVTALARSALLGAVWSGVSSDLTFISQALYLAADQVAAERLVLLFRQAIASARAREQARETRQSPDTGPVDELFWAYQVLGVLPTATDRDVHDAWRRKRAENHPDHAGGDPAEFERRSRISRDINHARDVIVNHRYPGTRGATHAWAS